MTERTSFSPDDIVSRRSGIGGSDASAIMGHNKHKTKYQLAREKIGLDTPENTENEFTQWGHWMEEWYLRKFNIRKPKQTFFSNFANYMYCHLDGFKKGVLYEIKAPVYGHHNLHVDDWRDLPMHYIWQLVHNGFVYKTHGQRAKKLTNVELVIVMAPQPISYVIPWADLEIELLDKYLEVSEKFWMDCINDILPPPETKNDMRLAYPSVNTNEYPEATNEELINIKTLNDLKNQKKKIDTEIDTYSNLIRGAIKDYEGLSRNGDIVASNKSSKTGTRLLKTFPVTNNNEF